MKKKSLILPFFQSN